MNKDSPLVSIIIPVFNTEPYLERCLDSIINQTHSNLEIILVIEPCNDNSLSICRSYSEKDSRIVLFQNSERKGPAITRDIGLDYASGEWIGFIDSDDMVSDVYIETLLTVAIRNNCQISRCSYFATSDLSTPLPVSATNEKIFTAADFFLYCLLYDNHICSISCFLVWGGLYNNSLAKKMRFGNYLHAEDSIYFRNVCFSSPDIKIALTESCLYRYNIRENSVMRSVTFYYSTEITDYLIETSAFFKNIGENVLQEVFHRIYCENNLIPRYLLLSRDYPEQENRQALKNVILDDKEFIKKYRSNYIYFKSYIKQIWQYIADNPVVIYGYGAEGKHTIHPWLKYFGVEIAEIWDKQISPAHGNLSNDVYIIIAIRNKYVAALAESDLQKLGYNNFLDCETVNSAIMWAAMNEFLPELLETADEG